MIKFYSLIALIFLSIDIVSATDKPVTTVQQAIPIKLFPADNVWNTPIDNLPVDANSDAYISEIGASKNIHPDFGSGLYNGNPIGIPYVLVSGSQPKVKITFDYSDESDPGPYPIPPNPPIEGGTDTTGDCHVLVVDTTNAILYETWSTHPNADGSWRAGSGAIFVLKSNALRPDGWTSSDAAGLPVLPGLVRYDEVTAGSINHAIRLTVVNTRNTYIWPARHKASSKTATNIPQFGQRFRLKSTFDISKFSAANQVILKALKKYGFILADNGSDWFFQGDPNDGWNNDDLNVLKTVHGSDFEAVDCSSLMIDPNSGQAKQADEDVQDVSSNVDDVQIFPNPFQAELNIIISNPELVTGISLINYLGETVRSINPGQNIILNSIDNSGNGLSDGVYYLNVQYRDRTIHKKVVKY